MKLVIKEVQNLNSNRNGETIEVSNMRQAKRKATSMQCFHGTVLKIERESGELLAYKDGNKWTDVFDMPCDTSKKISESMKGNTNRKAKEDEEKDSQIYVRVTKQTKAKATRLANSKGMRLQDWLIAEIDRQHSEL